MVPRGRLGRTSGIVRVLLRPRFIAIGLALLAAAFSVIAFFTSASAFVMPVVEIDGAAIGTGKVGAVVPRLREIYLDEMRKAAV